MIKQRVPLVARDNASEAQIKLMNQAGHKSSDGGDTHILRVLANHPKLLEHWLPFGDFIFFESSLDQAQRELLMLRTVWLCKAPYIWAHHVEIAEELGFSVEGIEAVKNGSADASWSTSDRSLLKAAEELHDHQRISDKTWEELTSFLSQEQMIEVVFSCGNYTMLCMALNSFGLPLERGYEVDPSLSPGD